MPISASRSASRARRRCARICKLLVMSATLDLEPLARLLDGAPTVSAEGRSFEVATHYVARRAEIALELQTAQVIRSALADHHGDILCFLPGAAEIRPRAACARGIRRGSGAGTAGIAAERAAARARRWPCAFCRCTASCARGSRMRRCARRPGGERKVVLATSIAETSLTIEGIRVVIDAGLRRYSAFDPATGMSRLVTGEGLASGRGPAPRPCRPARARACATGCGPKVRRHRSRPTRPRKSRARISRRSRSSSPAGGPPTPAGCAGSTRRPRRPSPRRATCCASSRRSMRPVA